MGKIMSIVSRPIKNFNIEERAHKIISNSKPIAAPRYQSNIEEAERLLRENPDSMKELLKKDSVLDTHLKDVYVKSHDTLFHVPTLSPDDTWAETIQKSGENVDRPLPLNRRIVEQFEFGFHEPISVPIGRCTLRQALKFLTSHQEDSNTWNSAKIALEYNISEDKIKSILHYFRIYKVYIPEKRSKYVIAEPSIPKKQLFQEDSIKKLIEKDGKPDK